MDKFTKGLFIGVFIGAGFILLLLKLFPLP
jgi:hypothetical protein